MQAVPAGPGRRPELDAELAQLGDPDLILARVLAQHRGGWVVSPAEAAEPRLVPARGRVHDQAAGPPVTGDWVALDRDGAITAVLSRRGTIVRRAAGQATRPQVLAANVDLALVVEPLPDPSARRAERVTALARAGGVGAALLLTKADLADDAPVQAARLARRLGLVDAVAVSATEAADLRVLGTLLVPGSTAVLLGPSGAGKSTLVNALLGEARQATRTVRAGDRRGRHTTVTRELLTLPTGALLIDTPGVREAGLWDGAGDAFADIDTLAARCRFADCGHDGEPGCAVRAAVEPDRLEAWRKLQREQARLDDRRAAARERAQLGRRYLSTQREARRRKGR